MTNFFSVKFRPDRIIRSHYLGSVSTELQTDVDVLRDMLMSRENKLQCIFIRDEIETVIRVICAEYSMFLGCFLYNCFLLFLHCTSSMILIINK